MMPVGASWVSLLPGGVESEAAGFFEKLDQGVLEWWSNAAAGVDVIYRRTRRGLVFVEDLSQDADETGGGQGEATAWLGGYA